MSPGSKIIGDKVIFCMKQWPDSAAVLGWRVAVRKDLDNMSQTAEPSKSKVELKGLKTKKTWMCD